MDDKLRREWGQPTVFFAAQNALIVHLHEVGCLELGSVVEPIYDLHCTCGLTGRMIGYLMASGAAQRHLRQHAR